MVGETGHARLKTSALDCLPTPEKPSTWAESRAKLEQVETSPFAAFAGKGLLAQVKGTRIAVLVSRWEVADACSALRLMLVLVGFE
eukprot:4115188-Alexandrium_andersonii.AAC.1